MTSRMRMAGGSLVVICLIGWWLSLPLATDITLSPLPTSSDLESLLWKTFNAPPLDQLGDQHMNIDADTGFTHIRLRYSSLVPFVVAVNPAWITENRYAFSTGERIGGIVPPGNDATVTLPMSASVSWKLGMRQAVVYVYAPRNSTPQLIAAEPFSAGIGPGLRQLATSEQWTLASVNFLRGYRIAGVSLSVLLGMAMIIAMIILRRRFGDIHAALLAGMCAIAIFAARSGSDLLTGTAVAVLDWRTHGTLAELGDVVTMANDLRDDSRTVATCGYSDAPVAYGIFPKKLSTVSTAEVAVLPTAWTTNDGVMCGSTIIGGSILRTYPSGGGIAELRTSPSVP